GAGRGGAAGCRPGPKVGRFGSWTRGCSARSTCKAGIVVRARSSACRDVGAAGPAAEGLTQGGLGGQGGDGEDLVTGGERGGAAAGEDLLVADDRDDHRAGGQRPPAHLLTHGRSGPGGGG